MVYVSKFNFIFNKIVLDSLISNCSRDFGNKNGVNQTYLKVLGILFGIVNGSSRFLWGYLMDKFGFKPLMSIIAAVEVIVSASFYFIVKFDFLYIFSVLLIAACIGGHFSILAPLFNKVYGIEIGPQAYGICGFFIGMANLTGPLLTMFLLKEKKHYLIAFLIGGSLVLIKIFCLLIFNEEEKYVSEGEINNIANDKSIGALDQNQKQENENSPEPQQTKNEVIEPVKEEENKTEES